MKKLVTRIVLLLLCWLPVLAQAQNRPDLVIIAPFTVPTNMLAGASYPMSAVIKNQGTNGSQFNCIGYYLSADTQWDATDAYLGASCQSLMFPGQSGTCSITGMVPTLTVPGRYYLLLVADPLNAEQELDETNNVISFSVTVAAGGNVLPDLELWRPSLAFSAIPPGGSTGAFTFVYNRGPVAVGAYEIGYYLSADTVYSAGADVFLGLVTSSSLSATTGTVHSAPVLPVPATTVPGNYYVVLMADPRNLITEANENNNSRALPLRITGTATATALHQAGAVQLYPNPLAQGALLTVNLVGTGETQPVELTVYDALGRQVAHHLIARSDQPQPLDLNNLAAGMYQLRLTGQTLRTTQRLVVN